MKLFASFNLTKYYSIDQIKSLIMTLIWIYGTSNLKSEISTERNFGEIKFCYKGNKAYL